MATVPKTSIKSPRKTTTNRAVDKPNGAVDKKKNNNRINCRINANIKERAEAAAGVLGQSITAFTETALAEKAQAVLAEQERIVLSEQEFARFVAILEDPTPPTPALVKAMRTYKATKAAHPDRGL